MAASFRGISILSLALGVAASTWDDVTVTQTHTRTLYTCPCDTTTYFVQTSPAALQPSTWLSWYTSASTGTTSRSYMSSASSISGTSTVSSTITVLTTSTASPSGPISTSGSTTGQTSSTGLSTSSSTSTSTNISQSGTSSSSTTSSSSQSSSTSSSTIASSSTSTTSSSTTTTSTASATPFSIQVTYTPPLVKRAESSVGFVSGQAVLVTDATSAYAFAITAQGSLIIYGTTTTVGTLRDDGVRNLQQVLPADGTNAMLTGWTLVNGALTYPSATFCVSSTNQLQVAFGIPDSSCNIATLVADTSTDSFNLNPSSPSTTTSTLTTTTTAPASTSCVVDVADPNRPCTPGRIYQQGGAIFQEYCDVVIQSTGGPPISDFENRSYDTCASVCAKSSSCDGFGAALTNPPPANSGPCVMFSGIRYSPATTPGTGYRGGKKLSAAPCGASATYVTTTSTATPTSTGPVLLAAPTATSCTARYPYPDDSCMPGQLYYYSGYTPQLYSITGCQVNITGTPIQKTTETGWDDCAKKCLSSDACEAYMFTQFNPFLVFGSGFCNLFDNTNSFIGARYPGWAGVKSKTLPPGC